MVITNTRATGWKGCAEQMPCSIIDSHCDTVRLFELKKKDYSFTKYNQTGHIDLPRLRAGGVKLQFFALYIEEEFKPAGSLKRSLALLDLLYRSLEPLRNDISFIYKYADLTELNNNNKIGALISIEGGEALEGNIGVLRMLFRLGVRGLGLTWNQANQLATGVGKGVGGKGLSTQGRRVIREMNHLGMIVDLAHINERGFSDALETSGRPVIVSHANSRALCDHPRNLSDDQLRALRDAGGVIGLSFCPDFVDPQQATVERLLDHFVHIAGVAGVDHLGFGSDFDGIEEVIPGLEDVTAMPVLVESLQKRGFNGEEIAKITTQNFLRVLEEILPA
jgi:membrane dipeptidase